MPQDFENTINLDQMTDDDIRELVEQHLGEDEEFDVEAVDVVVEDGHVRVEGRVGTEEERQRVEQLLNRFGAEAYDNNVVVDENVRSQRPEAADMARLEDAAATDALGESGKSTSDTAEHLLDDTVSDQRGTRDLGKAVEGGRSYSPPDHPIQEGIGGDEDH